MAGCSTPGRGDVLVDGPVVTDSRLAGPGALYVARIGEHADGHDFVEDAAARGAVAAITQRPVGPLPAVVVAESDRGPRRRWPERVIDARARPADRGRHRILRQDEHQGPARPRSWPSWDPTVAPEGSYNSEVGVPLTVLRVDETTRTLVVEMGARGIGHIAYLTRIAPLDIAVVLNVGSAHVGEFGSREAIATAKGELVRGLRAGGVAVLNADDAAVAGMAALAPGRVVRVGRGARRRRPGGRRSARRSGPRRVRAGQPARRRRRAGERPAAPAWASTTSTTRSRRPRSRSLAGLAWRRSPTSLSSAEPISRWRMEIRDRADGVRIVNDAYNANPESMRAALQALAAMAGGRRTWAVLGDDARARPGVRGEPTPRLGETVADLGIDRLVVVGEAARPAYDAARARADWGGEAEFRRRPHRGARAARRAGCATGDVVLVKSSRDSGLRLLGDELADGGGAG